MAFKVDEKKKPLITVIAIIAIAASIGSMLFSQCESRPKVNLKPFISVGQVMAEETGKLFPSGGSKVVIIQMDDKQYSGPAATAQIKAFIETCQKEGKVSIAGTEKFALNKGGEGGPVEPGMPLPSDFYFQTLEKYPDVGAIVSFVGAPMLRDEELSRLGEKPPKLVAFCQFGMGLKQLFEQQVVHVVICPRFHRSADTKKPDTSRDWFDQYYQVVTPETASTLPF